VIAPVVILVSAAVAAAPAPRTLRLDYLHTGSATEERFAFDGLVLEGPWPGPPDRLVDDTNLGKYLYEVRDRKSDTLLYSRGFASIYGEWETTGEAKERSRGFSESVRFPEPRQPVRVVLKKRGRGNEFEEAWSVSVDPADPAIDRSGPSAARAWAVIESGEPRDKVDLLLSQAAKWKDLIAPGTPLPTPWPKEAFEAAQREIQERRRRIRAEKRPEQEMEALFLEERERITKLLASGPHAGKVGAFEGALYEAKGYYRPQADCIMFTRDQLAFCAVCRRAIERVIGLYARPAGAGR